ncbi:MAG: hypothetical protein DHS20C01_16220 [marine bacterium B5-7]|nr:MAG: hypothetical protein DHS20C01_16220 [marine bacterium B5-7]
MNFLGRLLLISCLFLSLDAYAVGLGKLRVLSALDQPLNAEIELISPTEAELNTLRVGIASRSDYSRANIERSALLSLIRFEIEARDNGESVIHLTTQESVSDPFLHMLVALDWAGGKLIREYTALLDPPLYAQGRPASVSSPRRVGATTGTVPRQTTAGGSASPSRPASPVKTGELYGPIKRGETVSGLVNRMNLGDDIDVFQAMIALLKRNPDAFIRGNINLIKEGSTLSLPTRDEMASISRVVASAEYSKQLNEWLAYRNRVADSRLASGATSSPLPQTEGEISRTPSSVGDTTNTTASADTGTSTGDTSGLSEDVLRIIQSEQGTDGASLSDDSGEIGSLKSQLAVMEESLLSTELENKGLRQRLSALEEQIKETNKLLKLNNPGLALAEQRAADAGSGISAVAPGDSADADNAGSSADADSRSDGSTRVTTTGSSSLMQPLTDLLRGDMLWKLLLGLAALVLLIGIIVYVRRRQSYAEFEETMMTGSTYDLRSQSTGFTQMPRMDTTHHGHSHPSTRADSQTGSLMQNSFMTEMGAPGMGAMQADEVDPVAEAEVYMAYGRDQQAMEVLQDAIRRDPGRAELKIKLLEVYQKRKDVRAFESLAEELYPVIGKDSTMWTRVVDMGRRVSPRHSLFVGTVGGATSTIHTGRSRSNDGLSLDRDSTGLDFVSAPFTRGTPRSGSTDRFEAGHGGSRDTDLTSTRAELTDSETDSVTVPLGGFSTPAAGGSSHSGFGGADTIDDFKASEIATKLDLAKAYLEMGDKDAARGFLEEVLKDGNESQRQQASELASST